MRGARLWVVTMVAWLSFSEGAAVTEFSVMTYNVENLFDTKDDPDRDDETYLPASLKESAAHARKCRRIRRKHWRDQCLNWDWSPEVYREKVNRIATVVRQADGGRGPDILILQEVENQRALEALQKALGRSRYPTAVLLEGGDIRGIDVAILSRYPRIGEPKIHRIPFQDSGRRVTRDSRPILEVALKVGEETVTVLGAHFPAPYHPRRFREQGMDFLNTLEERAAKQAAVVVAGGDFNVIAEEDSRLYRQRASERWDVSHLVGCRRCLGTSYYERGDSWSFLDAILVSRRSRSWEMIPDSVKVLTEAQHQSEAGKPAGFDLRGKTVRGISDHWPVYLRLRRKP